MFSLFSRIIKKEDIKNNGFIGYYNSNSSISHNYDNNVIITMTIFIISIIASHILIVIIMMAFKGAV